MQLFTIYMQNILNLQFLQDKKLKTSKNFLFINNFFACFLYIALLKFVKLYFFSFYSIFLFLFLF